MTELSWPWIALMLTLPPVAGWLVALCGDLQTMPGFSATRAVFHVSIDDNGRTVGLF